MKPLQLTMTAFGPYKEKEQIDFRKLENHQLFVISGNTGAGKTTIFDAISFALYGEASGEERKDSKMLRSHFADDETNTTVNLVFQLKNKTYRIYRKLGHLKKGNKNPSLSTAEFYEIQDEKEIPCCPAKIQDVNKKVEALIGLTKSQFSQIVMLPQGEFRKLLTSDTDNKEEILRRIFKTETYQRLKERFDEKRKDAQKETEEIVAKLQLLYGNMQTLIPEREASTIHDCLKEEQVNHHQLTAALEEELSHYHQQIVEKKAILEHLQKLFKEKDEHFHQAKQLEEWYSQYELSCQKKQTLLIKSKEMNDQRFLLERAEKALGILPFEENVRIAQKRRGEKEQEIEQTKESLSNLKNEQALIQSTFEIEKEKEPERKEKEQLLHQLTELKPVVQTLAKQEKEVESYKLNVQQMEQKSEKIRDTQITFEKDKAEIMEEIKEKEAKVTPLTNLKIESERLIQDGKRFLKLVTTNQEIESKKQEVQQAKELFQIKEKQYGSIEQAWIEGQASLLALHLHDGEACPVCGSLSHPNKALKVENIPTKEEIEHARKEKQAYEKEYQARQNECIVLENNKQTLREELKERGYLCENAELELEQHRERFKEHRNKIRSLELIQLQLETKKHQKEALEKRLEELAQEKEQIQQQLIVVRAKYENGKGSLDANREKIPRRYQSEFLLTNQIKVVEREKKALDEKWEEVQRKKREVDEQMIQYTSQLVEKEASLAELKRNEQEALERLQKELYQAAFRTMEDFQQAKTSLEKIQQMKRNIENYERDTKQIDQHIQHLEQQINKRERPDLVQLRNQLDGYEKEKIKAFEDVHQLHALVEQMEQLKKQYETLLKNGEEKEQKYRMVLDLYEMIRGNNQKKVSFERYLQIEFLEKIIFVANQRLYQLSNGQFSLKRSDRVEKNGKQSGLGLDVYDEYTGQTRDVKTLSGGEKFNASLCLALGMADVIQAYQGGISIETMFIDEGFGSLDEESLQKAIETLVDLQKSGRMIGIISHVQELKQAIPAILEVKKTKEGHSYTQFVFK